MKRVYNVFLVFVVVLWLAACSDQVLNNSDNQTNTQKVQETSKQITTTNNVETKQISNKQEDKKQVETTKQTETTKLEQNIKTVDVTEFKKYLKQNDITLIDLRTPQELKETWVINPKAINFDVYNPNFPQKIGQLDKNKTYLIYCRSGSRSGRVREYMKQLWFKNVIELQWWIINWYNSWEKFYPYGEKQSSVQNSSKKQEEYKTITINARSFEFDKKVIRVKQWEKVKIKVNNMDTLHGIDIPAMWIWDETEVILDTSKKWEFDFICWNYCGAWHSQMKWKIIIDIE